MALVYNEKTGEFEIRNEEVKTLSFPSNNILFGNTTSWINKNYSSHFNNSFPWNTRNKGKKKEQDFTAAKPVDKLTAYEDYYSLRSWSFDAEDPLLEGLLDYGTVRRGTICYFDAEQVVNSVATMGYLYAAEHIWDVIEMLLDIELEEFFEEDLIDFLSRNIDATTFCHHEGFAEYRLDAEEQDYFHHFSNYAGGAISVHAFEDGIRAYVCNFIEEYGEEMGCWIDAYNTKFNPIVESFCVTSQEKLTYVRANGHCACVKQLYSPDILKILQLQREAISILSEALDESDIRYQEQLELTNCDECFIDYHLFNYNVLEKISSQAITEESLSLIYQIIDHRFGYAYYEGNLYKDMGIESPFKIYNVDTNVVFTNAESLIEWINSQDITNVESCIDDICHIGLTRKLEKWIRNFFSIDGRCVTFD